MKIVRERYDSYVEPDPRQGWRWWISDLRGSQRFEDAVVRGVDETRKKARRQVLNALRVLTGQ